MTEVSQLSKKDLISNLWMTDELMSQMRYFEQERAEKKKTLVLTIESTQKEYIASVKEKYYGSEDFKAHQKYEELCLNLKDFREVALLLDLIIGVLISYLLFMIGVKFLSVVLSFVVIVLLIYLFYYVGVKYYLKQKKPLSIPTLEAVIEEAKESYDYQHIEHSLLANHLREEIHEIDQKISQLESELVEKTVLPEKYRHRSKDVIWYLENLVADNLKEALSALIEDDHRKQMKQMIDNQNHEIRHLKEISHQLIENHQRLIERLETQQQRIEELEGKKK